MQLNNRTLKIAGIVVAAVLVIFIALPLFINVNSFPPENRIGVDECLGTARDAGRSEPFALQRQSRRGEC